ncbi:unnamed protein product [Mytilus coruscus]|uniref:HECT domain-containing protein n=1 Tax=Mytilus coruscus TaxID=42192 RepID=A0A6J8D704_MYTCO|nr:unnamed protein product [Mytilus coruscus]
MTSWWSSRHIDVICVYAHKFDMSDNNLQRGNTWSLMETFCLIQCWADDAIEAELSWTHRNRYVYEKISYKMKEHGYVRSWDACRTKIRALRAQYLKAKQQNNTSGQERAKFAYFEEIDKFMGTRPIVQPELRKLVLKNESAETETSQKDDINANLDQGVEEKEQKKEINQKKPISKKRKRKRDDTFGEQGIDNGGLTREFLQLAVTAIKQFGIFEGEEDYKNIAMNYSGFEEKDYKIYGQIISYSLVHGEPAPTFLVKICTMIEESANDKEYIDSVEQISAIVMQDAYI